MPDRSPRRVLIEAGHVVTMDQDRRILREGSILIEDASISSVGAADEIMSSGEPDLRIDATGCVVVPGLINTHQHHWYNLFKGLGGGMLLEQWIANLLVPTARALTTADLEVSARLACLEMVGTGTTTFLNHSVTQTDADDVSATLRPTLEFGMRQVFAKEIRPTRLDEQLALAEQIHRDWNEAGGGRVTIGFVIESTAHWVALGTSSEELILRGNELAERLGAHISDHIAGGTMSRDQGYLHHMLKTGRTDIEFLHRLGVLDQKWILAHAINARDRDIDLIAQSGASVSHTPTSESARGGGITPIRRFREAGVLVALGSDGPMVDTSVDMVEQMKSVVLFQNQLHLDPSAVTPFEALEMSTIEAAKAIGLEDRLGFDRAGKARRCGDLRPRDSLGRREPRSGCCVDSLPPRRRRTLGAGRRDATRG
jgi:5-methylthioadenosine/S-adenosylhomocysteine deaminase